MNTPTVTAVILTKNSGATIKEALDAARSIADQTVVVDTGSTDHTKHLVKGRPEVQLHAIPWEDSFSKARNYALDNINDGVIIYIDSDEWIEKKNVASARYAIRSIPKEIDSAWSPIIYDEETSYETRHVPRILWANSQMRYQYRVHERLSLNGRTVTPENVKVLLNHSGYSRNHNNHQKKRARNLTLLSYDLREHPTDPHPLFFFLRDGIMERTIDENLDLVREISELCGSATKSQTKFDILAKKILLSHHWMTTGDNEVSLRLAKEIKTMSPDDADACYVTGTIELLKIRTEMERLLRETAELRNKIGDTGLTWGMSVQPHHLDSLLLELMQMLGHRRRDDLDQAISKDWNDPYFSASILRRRN